jgi:hypothetical protein
MDALSRTPQEKSKAQRIRPGGTRWLPIVLLVLALAASVGVVAWGELQAIGEAVGRAALSTGYVDHDREFWKTPEGRREDLRIQRENGRSKANAECYSRVCDVLGGGLALVAVASFAAYRLRSSRP